MNDHTREDELRARAQAEYERLKSDVNAARAAAAPTAESRPAMSPLTAPSHSTGDESPRIEERASIGSLLSDISTQASRLIRGEIEHAQLSIKGKITKLGIGGVLFAAAVFVALYMLGFFFVTLALVLSIWLPVWAGFAIVTGLLTALVIVLALMGKRKFTASQQYEVGKGLGKDMSAIKDGLKK